MFITLAVRNPLPPILTGCRRTSLTVISSILLKFGDLNSYFFDAKRH